MLDRTGLPGPAPSIRPTITVYSRRPSRRRRGRPGGAPESRFGGAIPVALEIVAAGAARLGIMLDAEQCWRLGRFVELLLARNQQLNLTRIVEPAEVERRHLLDSLTCALPVLDLVAA